MPKPLDEIDLRAVRNWLAMHGKTITHARLAYRWAADAGNGAAAHYLGYNSNPQGLAALGTVGISGELWQSIHWYERAGELGAPKAKSQLAAITARGGLR